MLRKIFLIVSAFIFISANLLAQTAPPLAANPKYSLRNYDRIHWWFWN